MSFEIAAVAMITEVVKRAAAIASLSPAGLPSTPAPPRTASSSSETSTTARMPMPEIGLAEEPTKPAM